MAYFEMVVQRLFDSYVANDTFNVRAICMGRGIDSTNGHQYPFEHFFHPIRSKMLNERPLELLKPKHEYHGLICFYFRYYSSDSWKNIRFTISRVPNYSMHSLAMLESDDPFTYF